MAIPGRDFRRILIVRLGAMGDVIHGMPAVAALRLAFPEAKIGWVVEDRWSDLLRVRGMAAAYGRGPQSPLVDTVHLANTRAWRDAPFSDETWRAILGLRREMRNSNYDALIDLQGSLKSAIVASTSGVPSRFGFTAPRERVATMFYTEVVGTSASHVVDQNVELASALATAPLAAGAFEFPFDAAAEEWCSRELARHALKNFVIINPGAGWGAKCWPVERYAELARALGTARIRTIVNHGPGEEAMAQSIQKDSEGLALALKMALPELVAVTRRARLFIGGDTGPMHLAAALKVPVVALFGPTNPDRNGPYGTHAVVLRSDQSRTSHHRTEEPDKGLNSIKSEVVIAAARELLEHPHG